MSNPLTVDAPAGVPFIDTVRDFDFPLAAVWRAYTEPGLIQRWMGPHDTHVEDLVFEPRTGCSWSWNHRGPDAVLYGFRGVLHEVDEPRSITQTFEFSGYPGHVSLQRVDFEDLGGRTRVRAHLAFQSQADRDGMAASGMERGMSEGYDRLDGVLATL